MERASRELLLRRRIDFIVIAAPPAMTFQWKDELEAKFGLSFEIIDRERIAEMRRLRGFSVNPWATGSRFIISHRLPTDEVYAAGLRDMLQEFRPCALFMLGRHQHEFASAMPRDLDGLALSLVLELAELAPELEGRRLSHTCRTWSQQPCQCCGPIRRCWAFSAHNTW